MSKVMYALGILASITTFFLVMCPTTNAQTMRKIEIKGDDGVAMLNEVGAIIILEDGKLKIINVAPAELRPAAYKSVDLREGDVVAMANGKRMVKPLELDSLYKAARIGDEIKLGIKRGEQMMIVAFAKADEKDLPKRQIKMVGGPGGEEDTNVVVQKFGTHGGADDLVALPAAGILVGDRKGRPVIIEQLENPIADPRTKDFKVDDIIISIDGQLIASAEAAGETMSMIADGQEVKYVVDRGGKQITIIFTKHASKAKVKINRG